jgi:hypothetical protein
MPARESWIQIAYPDRPLTDFHPACHAYFGRALDEGLHADMTAALAEAMLQHSQQDFRFLRQIEIDMDDDMRRKIADLEACLTGASNWIAH